MIPYSLSPEKRRAFKEALGHYYKGLEESESAEVFFAACARAVMESHDRGDRIPLPLRFVSKQPV
jgi:hypothetical protein